MTAQVKNILTMSTQYDSEPKKKQQAKEINYNTSQKVYPHLLTPPLTLKKQTGERKPKFS